MFKFQSPSKRKPPDLRHPCHPWYRWSIHYCHKLKISLPVTPLQTNTRPKNNVNFSRANHFETHRAFFKQPAIFHMIREIFLYFGLLNFIASDSFLFFVVHWNSNHHDWKKQTKHHFNTSRHHVFSKQTAILSFCFTCCLTCAARITMKYRRSDLQPFPQGNLKHMFESSFAYLETNQNVCMAFVCSKYHHCNSEYCSLRGYNTTGHHRHNFGTVMDSSSDGSNQHTASLSERVNISTGILQEYLSSYLGNAVLYDMKRWSNVVWCKCMQSLPDNAYVAT